MKQTLIWTISFCIAWIPLYKELLSSQDQEDADKGLINGILIGRVTR